MKEKTVTLTGTVLVDGQPRGNASISFVPKAADGGARTAYAKTESDGSFSATTYVTGDGIIPGSYTISLGSEADGASTDPSAMMAAAQGAAINSSEITVPPEGLTDVEIKLTSSGSGSQKKEPGRALLGQ
ncbi:hypothetical protein [Fuerstiella marisgermanici]|nr:hypothetical protein [Fuerstiella marisgermanici]